MEKNFELFRQTLKDLQFKMNKITKMCENTDFKVNEALQTLHDGLIDIIDIKCLNSEIQKVKDIFIFNFIL